MVGGVGFAEFVVDDVYGAIRVQDYAVGAVFAAVGADDSGLGEDAGIGAEPAAGCYGG